MEPLPQPAGKWDMLTQQSVCQWPPICLHDGRVSWLRHEELIDDWTTTTSVEPETNLQGYNLPFLEP